MYAVSRGIQPYIQLSTYVCCNLHLLQRYIHNWRKSQLIYTLQALHRTSEMLDIYYLHWLQNVTQSVHSSRKTAIHLLGMRKHTFAFPHIVILYTLGKTSCTLTFLARAGLRIFMYCNSCVTWDHKKFGDLWLIQSNVRSWCSYLSIRSTTITSLCTLTCTKLTCSTTHPTAFHNPQLTTTRHGWQNVGIVWKCWGVIPI